MRAGKYSLNEALVIEKMADFQQGVMDCDRGIRHKEGQSKDYDRGYARQYEEDQRATHLTRNRNE
jgi:hypothetical protein